MYRWFGSLFFVGVLAAQTGPVAHIVSGPTLPRTCSNLTGDVFNLTSGSISPAGFYQCSTNNTYVLISPTTSPQAITSVTTDPSGGCTASALLQYNATNGHLSGCVNNTYSVIATSTLGGSLTGTLPNPGLSTLYSSSPLASIRTNSSFAGRQPVSQIYNGAGNTQSSGSDIQRSFRNIYYTTQYTYDFVVCYTNAYISTSLVQTGPGNAVNLTLGLEYNGATVQATFQGAVSILVPNGGEVCTDVIPMEIPAATAFYIRHALTVSGSQKFIIGSGGGASSTYTDLNDVTTSTGAMATGGAGAAMSTVSGIYGTTYPLTSACIYLSADSIGAGSGDNPSPRANETPATGYLVRGLGGAGSTAPPYCFIQTSVGGTTIAERILTLAPSLQNQMTGAEYAISAAGVNDLGGSTGTIEANYVTHWQEFTNRGIPVWQITLLPKTTSTDGWRTQANQTVTANETQRIALNTWIRSVPTPLTGYIETANLMECNSSNTPTLNGGFWCVPNAAVVTSTSTGSNTSSSLHDTNQAWTVNAYTNYTAVITGGLGVGETSLIYSNTSTVLTVSGWSPSTPDNTSTYVIQQTLTNDGTHPTPVANITLAAPITAWATANVVGKH